MFKSNLGPFRDELGEKIFVNKYQHDGCETWRDLARVLVEDVCREHLSNEEKGHLTHIIATMQFIPGGRYLYYAGRPKRFYNNCYLLNAEEDTREDWANLSWKSESCLLTGGGIGVDYSEYRPAGATIKQTGGKASGPIPKSFMVNEIGRNVLQGGSRRSAIYASLNWRHGDAYQFLTVKDWASLRIPGTDITYASAKEKDFNYPAPLDMTNISINYDTEWLVNYWRTNDVGELFLANCTMALKNGEPGFSFNFFEKEEETLRNACTEVCSADDSDVCNLGSINISRIENLTTFGYIVELATKFLLCGTLVADLPYDKVAKVREKNRRLGLGLMGMHEWLLQRGQRYEVTDEMHKWLSVYSGVSDRTSKFFSRTLGVNAPVAVRAIAPTGTIALLAGTTQGIEPIYAVAFKRRYLTEGTKWKYQYVVDHTANLLINELGINPDDIETANHLASDYERRISFQADVQDYVDMCISSTINLPATNSIDPKHFSVTLAKYAHRLRGFTCYPDGARGGQPITMVDYSHAKERLGEEFDDNIEVYDSCKEGVCGI